MNDAQAAVMQTAHETWDTQRELAAQVRALVKQYTESKYNEYRWIRGCSHEAAAREAKEYAENLCEGAIVDSFDDISHAEFERRRSS